MPAPPVSSKELRRLVRFANIFYSVPSVCTLAHRAKNVIERVLKLWFVFFKAHFRFSQSWSASTSYVIWEVLKTLQCWPSPRFEGRNVSLCFSERERVLLCTQIGAERLRSSRMPMFLNVVRAIIGQSILSLGPVLVFRHSSLLGQKRGSIDPFSVVSNANQ